MGPLLIEAIIATVPILVNLKLFPIIQAVVVQDSPAVFDYQY
jgi:hypothetical protein